MLCNIGVYAPVIVAIRWPRCILHVLRSVLSLPRTLCHLLLLKQKQQIYIHASVIYGMYGASVYNIVLLLVAIHMLAAVLGYDSSQGAWLDSQKNGYLYNLGSHKFIGTESEDTQGKKWSYLVDNPSKATLMRIVGTVEDGRVYNLITVINETAKGPKSGQWSWKASLGAINGINSGYIGIDNQNNAKEHMFTFTAPAYMDTQAFRIFIDDYCLDYNGDRKYVQARNCVSASNSRIKNQLWVWVNEERYERDIRNNYFDYENMDRGQDRGRGRDRQKDVYGQRHSHPNERERYTGYYNPREKYGPDTRDPYSYAQDRNGRSDTSNKYCRDCLTSSNPSSCPYCDNYD